jgi:hypothetical protein
VSDIKHAEDCKCRQCVAQRNEPVTDTCSCCGKRRKCKYDVAMSRDKLTGKVPSWSPRYCVKECLGLTAAERQKKRDQIRQERRRNKEPALAYPIVGGPLDGRYAVFEDFYDEYGSPGDNWYHPEGRYAAHDHEYEAFNANGGGRKRVGGSPTMIFVHKSKLKPLIRGRDR